MKFARVAVAAADRTQLKQFAELSLGMKIEHHVKTEDLRAAVAKAVAPETEIDAVVAGSAPAGLQSPAGSPAPDEVVIDQAAVDAAMNQPVAAPDPDDPNETRWATILIHESERPGGKDAVFIQVNGRAIFVERNKPQTIKRKYLLVLQNAVERIGEMNGDEEIVWRDVPAYPFQMIDANAPAPGAARTKAA